MPNRLDYRGENQYIKPFSISIDENLIIVTGKNGSGKTQLLNLIESGAVEVYRNEAIIPKQRIKKIDMESGNFFTAFFEGYLPSPNIDSSIDNSLSGMIYLKAGNPNRDLDELLYLISIYTGLSKDELPAEVIKAVEDYNHNKLTNIIKPGKPKNYSDPITKFIYRYYQLVAQADLADRFKFSSIEVEKPEIGIDAEKVVNDLLISLDLPYYLTGIEEFKNAYIDNRLDFLASFLNNKPSSNSLASPIHFNIQLKHKITNNTILISQLSPGELALLNATAIIIHDLLEEKEGLTPQILIMDEPDAHMHPENASILLKFIRNEIIQKMNIIVIMSTHSPVTIATSNTEEAITMSEGEIRVNKSQFSLNKLMNGVPYIDILSRQNVYIFVEGKHDAAIYTSMHKLLSKNRKYKYIPHFFPAGPEEGTSNCIAVEHLIKHMPNNNMLFGIIDWDLKKSSADPLFVFAEGKRYSLENIMLDPVVMVCYHLQKGKRLDFITTIDYNDSVSELIKNPDKIQRAVNEWVEGILGARSSETRLCQYNGLEVYIDENYLQCNGHKLEKLVRERSPLFKQNRDHIINETINLMRDYESVIPSEFNEIFELILDR